MQLCNRSPASCALVAPGHARGAGASGRVLSRALPALPRQLRGPNAAPQRLERGCRRAGAVRAGLEGSLPPPLPHAAPPAPAQPATPWQRLLRQMARFGGVAALGMALALIPAGMAEAARSGGRMGGSSFGRSSFSSGGGGGFGRGAFGASAGVGGSRGGSSSLFGGGYRSSSRASPLGGGFGSPITPSLGSVRMNSFFLSPFGGMGYGMGYPMSGGGGGLLSLLFWGAFAVIMIQVVQGVMRNRAGGNDDTQYGGGYTEGYDEVVTVGKVQVGLLASARELQQDLERIADKADSDSPEGLHYILQETVLALMRNPDYCVYGFAKSKRERSAEDAETAFNQLSLQERGKFQKETRSNVGGMARRGSLKDKKPYAAGDKELIVVTLIVASDGGFKLPQITGRSDLRQALSILGACRADDLLAVEVLWTPEEEDDFFTVDDLAYDYPTLNTL